MVPAKASSQHGWGVGGGVGGGAVGRRGAAPKGIAATFAKGLPLCLTSHKLLDQSLDNRQYDASSAQSGVQSDAKPGTANLQAPL